MEYGYIEAEFEDKAKKAFRKVVEELCKQTDFYYSEVINYIKGDVSSKAHLTLFYGIIDNKVQKTKLELHLKKINLKTIKIGKLFLKPGYENQYKILCIEVLDENNNLKKIHESFKTFTYEQKVQFSTFKPHITLAYLKPKFKITKKIQMPKTATIKKIKYDI